MGRVKKYINEIINIKTVIILIIMINQYIGIIWGIKEYYFN